MSQNFGISVPADHVPGELRPAARYLVLIDAGGSISARLFDRDRLQVAEFDAGTEEIAVMTRGLRPQDGAAGPEWDQALQGHADEERRAATVYELDV
jgi:hypothetical protein